MIDLVINSLLKESDIANNFLNDNYKLKKGLYIKVNIDEPFDVNNFNDYLVVRNNHDSINEYNSALTGENLVDLVEYLSIRRRYSTILNDDANKCIDVPHKKIFSSSYNALFINYQTVADIESGSFVWKVNKDEINNPEFMEDSTAYYFKKYNFDRYKNMSETIEYNLNLGKLDCDDVEISDVLNNARDNKRLLSIDKCTQYFSDNYMNISKFICSLGFKERTNIFFYSKSNSIDDSIETYAKEYYIYLCSCLFNKQTANMTADGLKGGIGIGYNNSSGKPFIKPRTLNIPLVKSHSFEEAVHVKETFDVFKVISDNNHSKTFGFNLFGNNLDLDAVTELNNKQLFVKLHYKGKYIENYDLVGKTDSNYKCIGDEIISVHEYFAKIYSDADTNTEQRGLLENSNEDCRVKDLLADVMFIGVGDLNKYTEDEGVFRIPNDIGGISFRTKCGILFKKYKYIVHDFINMNESDSRYERYRNKILNSLCNDYIYEYITTMNNSRGFIFEVRKLLNIKFNLMRKLLGRDEVLNKLREFNNKVEEASKVGTDINISNDEEYYYLLGQIAYYIESRSRGNVNFSVFKYYLEKRKDSNLKDFLLAALDKYSYDISIHNGLFKSVLAEILMYTPNKNIKQGWEFFFIGICSKNVFYNKSAKSSDEVAC